MFILILGAPGSGKGTQGKILAERLGLPKITTGDILRAAMKDGTPLGKQAKEYYDKGQLVPDSVILDLIKAELAKPEAKDGAIFDDGTGVNLRHQALLLGGTKRELSDCSVSMALYSASAHSSSPTNALPSKRHTGPR